MALDDFINKYNITTIKVKIKTFMSDDLIRNFLYGDYKFIDGLFVFNQ